MLPVFALVLDKDVRAEDLLRLPELYAELGKGRSLTLKTFFLWVLISVYQGKEMHSCAVMSILSYIINVKPWLDIDIIHRRRFDVRGPHTFQRRVYSHRID